MIFMNEYTAIVEHPDGYNFKVNIIAESINDAISLAEDFVNCLLFIGMDCFKQGEYKLLCVEKKYE